MAEVIERFNNLLLKVGDIQDIPTLKLIKTWLTTASQSVGSLTSQRLADAASINPATLPEVRPGTTVGAWLSSGGPVRVRLCCTLRIQTTSDCPLQTYLIDYSLLREPSTSKSQQPALVL